MQTTRLRVSVFHGVMFVFSIMIVPSKAADTCDRGWFYMYNENEESGKCYYVSNSKRTFNRSISRCQGDGVQLASLSTKEESDFIESLFEDFMVADTANEYWLGMYRADVSSNNSRDGWVWLDGTDFNWVNWIGFNEPGGGERCARLRTDSNYSWLGKECGARYGCVCEKAAETAETPFNTALTAAATTTTTTTTTGATILTSRNLNTRTATMTASPATDNCACDSTEREGVLIAVGVVGWCLLVIVVAVGVVIICILKRRQRKLDLKLSSLVNGPKYDYEQVVWSEDEDTVKYESLRGSERSARPNQTYTTLSPE